MVSGLDIGSGYPMVIAEEVQGGSTEGLLGLNQVRRRALDADPNSQLKAEFIKLQQELQMLRKSTREKLQPRAEDAETQGREDFAHLQSSLEEDEPLVIEHFDHDQHQQAARELAYRDGSARHDFQLRSDPLINNY